MGRFSCCSSPDLAESFSCVVCSATACLNFIGTSIKLFINYPWSHSFYCLSGLGRCDLSCQYLVESMPSYAVVLELFDISLHQVGARSSPVYGLSTVCMVFIGSFVIWPSMCCAWEAPTPSVGLFLWLRRLTLLKKYVWQSWLLPLLPHSTIPWAWCLVRNSGLCRMPETFLVEYRGPPSVTTVSGFHCLAKWYFIFPIIASDVVDYRYST